jgi:methyl coenzyme M reductase beta subunit
MPTYLNWGLINKTSCGFAYKKHIIDYNNDTGVFIGNRQVHRHLIGRKIALGKV